jgi:tRNA nucleotidyltransferase (CCA-adding enzyme)
MARGVVPKDFDIATAATPEEVQRSFSKVIPTGIDHGTVTVLIEGLHVEVTTFRTEDGYEDGRRPTNVAFHTDIEADLSRRDFTMNAMAFDPSPGGRFVDPFKGVEDLRARLIRCVRDPLERFGEDGLRALRAVRFAAVLDFDIEPATQAAIAPTLPIFKRVAMERVREEFTKTLMAKQAVKGLALLEKTGLLDAFMPEALPTDLTALARAPEALELRLALILVNCANANEVLLRLRYPAAVAKTAAHLVTHQALPPPKSTDADLRRWLAKVGAEHSAPIVSLAAVRGLDTGPLKPRIDAILATRPALRTTELALDGKAIMQILNIAPGRQVGEATRALLEHVLDFPSDNTVEKLTLWLKSPKA